MSEASYALVLILVLMEDALVRFHLFPYEIWGDVLILVLMEDALVQSTWLMPSCSPSVLILVLMEDALVHVKLYWQERASLCLNPCFNGRCTRTRLRC